MVQKFASLLSAESLNYGTVIKKIENNNFDGLHFDVFDGHFVKNFAFGPGIIKPLKKITSLPFNIHLEVEEPELFFDMFIDAGGDIITFHPQACQNTKRALRYLKAKKIKTSIALDPDIRIDYIEEYLNLTDNVIVMTVYPGFGKQDFIHGSLSKIKKLKKTIENKGLKTTIAVDGCINDKTSVSVIENGADILIYGSSLFK